MHYFSIPLDITAGKPELFRLERCPPVAFAPIVIGTNFAPHLITVLALSAAGQSVLNFARDGAELGRPLYWPPVGPARPIVIVGRYSGRWPRGTRRGDPYRFIWTFSGELTLPVNVCS